MIAVHPSQTLVVMTTATRRYAAHAADLSGVRRVAPGDSHYVMFDLGALLDPADAAQEPLFAALIIPLRRRNVALLVTRVEHVLTHLPEYPLPALVQQHLQQPWACGLVQFEDTVIVRLDPRAVVRSAMAQRRRDSPEVL